MCGIAGFFRAAGRDRGGLWHTTPYNDDMSMGYSFSKEVSEELMLAALPGGHDAAGAFVGKWEEKTGLYTGAKNPMRPARLLMLKAPGPASRLVKDPRFKEIGNAAAVSTSSFMVGHTRAATGSTPANNRNNHPFISGEVVGVHNGILSNDRELAKKLNLDLKGECDSEVIFAGLDTFLRAGANVREAVGEMAKLLRGWYVVVFALQSDVTKLYIFKGDGGRLAFSMADPHNVGFFTTDASWASRACEAAYKRSLPQALPRAVEKSCLKVTDFPAGHFCSIDTMKLVTASSVLDKMEPLATLGKTAPAEVKDEASADKEPPAVQTKSLLN